MDFKPREMKRCGECSDALKWRVESKMRENPIGSRVLLAVIGISEKGRNGGTEIKEIVKNKFQNLALTLKMLTINTTNFASLFNTIHVPFTSASFTFPHFYFHFL